MTLHLYLSDDVSGESLCESFNFCYWLACKGIDLLLFAGFTVRMTSIKEHIGKHEDGASD